MQAGLLVCMITKQEGLIWKESSSRKHHVITDEIQPKHHILDFGSDTDSD